MNKGSQKSCFHFWEDQMVRFQHLPIYQLNCPFFSQVCSAGSRVLIQENVYDKLVKKLKERMCNLRVGNSLDKCVDMGAVITDGQKEAIHKFVEDAIKEGAEVIFTSNVLFFHWLWYISV